MIAKALAVCTLAILLGPTSVAAWWCGGHTILTKATFMALPESVPAFFRAGSAAAAHSACDPDLFNNKRVPELSAKESPEHYFDLELLDGRRAPSYRHQLLAICDSLGVSPSKVGYAPYATTEWTERLAIAFAEHRRWPENELIQDKCLLYSGIAVHYAQDLCQPLHVTVHFDGRMDDNGKVPHSGIHEGVDSLIERLHLSESGIAAKAIAASFADIASAVHEEMMRTHALVDTVYGHEQEIQAASGNHAENFANERAVAAARFSASLLLSAWELSENVELPGWLER